MSPTCSFAIAPAAVSGLLGPQWLIGVNVPELRELEAGTSWPDFDSD
jgi:hypothetical protein